MSRISFLCFSLLLIHIGCMPVFSDKSEIEQSCSGDPSFPEKIDILVVIDNSASMRSKQYDIAWALWELTEIIQNRYASDYHLAVITTGMESPGCPRCDDSITGSCVNDSGETGRFQDRRGKHLGSSLSPQYLFDADPSCRVVTRQNRNCFLDAWQSKGTILPGASGCAYERGLAPMRLALGELRHTYNQGFLRDDAVLAVVVVSDENDCGEVGDVSERVGGAMADICYFAAKESGPDGEHAHSNDRDLRDYRLTPVEEYYDFLLNLKGGLADRVKFASIVGVRDLSDLSTTTIDYRWSELQNRWEVTSACSIPGVPSSVGSALPGTRYIELAQMFGIGTNGFVDTICQTDFSESISRLTYFLEGKGSASRDY